MKNSKTKETICVDTNIILGIGRTIAHEYKKDKYIKVESIIQKILNRQSGILFNLSQRYDLVTPISSKYEFIKKLRAKDGISPDKSKLIFNEIISKFKIFPVTFKEERNFLTYNFFEELIKCELDLADGIQLFIAFRKKIPFVTGDRRDIEKMRKFYSDIFTYSGMMEKYEEKLKSKN